MITRAAALAPAAWELPLRDLPDQELVRLVKKGQVEAFSELVTRRQRVVYNLAYRFMRDPSLAEDMAQEAFLKAFRLLHNFRGDCSFATWLYRVTCSVCLTELNRRKKRREVELRPEHAGHGPDAAEQAGNADLPEFIRTCVSRLPENYATIITLYYLKEVPYEEIAAVMRIPLGTLKTWMHRARKQLRDIVEEEYGRHAASQ